ncbi:unnamed protein product [Mycena citricolor]|uniref:DUF829-domain-containing protein n=1 Tax=Mycena citricolor TaxID=2018698 RepID=A0AAD2JYP3_9AGAR|nr:unnamed protein product [Mycena citricolor]
MLALKRLLEEQNHQPGHALCSAWIIDSAPGGDSLYRSRLAFLSPIKGAAARFLAKWAFTLLYCLLHLVHGLLLRRPSPIHVMQESLARADVLPWMSRRTPRLYLYSTVDEMVPARDVEAHAAASAAGGLNVRMRRFERSAHAAHARVYPAEYWEAVQTCWAGVVRELT